MDLGIDDIVQSTVQELFDVSSSSDDGSDPRLPYAMQTRRGGSQSWQVQKARAFGTSTGSATYQSQSEGATASDEQSGALSDDEDDDRVAETRPKDPSTSGGSASAAATPEDDTSLSVSPAHVALGSLQLAITARHGPSAAAASLASRESSAISPSGAAAAAADDSDNASKAAKTAGLLASLQADKSRLKKHLRAEDEKFEREYHRKPSRADKEHLRPMYERYRVLKREIDELLAATKPAAAVPAAPTAKATTKGPKPGSLEALRTEKRALQIRLRRFEEDFRRANGRAVQFHRDIRPVEGEYRRYKDLKKRIAKLERDTS